MKENISSTQKTKSTEQQGINKIKIYKTVPLPENYSRYLGGRKEMAAEDLLFFEELLNKYKPLPESKKTQNKETNDERFFQAAADVHTRALDIRLQMDTDWKNAEPDIAHLPLALIIEKLKIYREYESERPSADRTQDIAELFVHHPKFRKPYLQIHAKKMAAALPGFIDRLDGPIAKQAGSRDIYFNNVMYLMEQSMYDVLPKFPAQPVEDLGAIISLKAKRYIPPKAYLPKIFAVTGIPDFSDLLRDIVDEVVRDGKDIQEAVRREFLERDGIGFQLMRTNQHHFVRRAKPDLQLSKSTEDNSSVGTNQPMDSETRRTILANNDYGIGQCPALLKTNIPDDSEERPIVYEYAAAIVSHMPQYLLNSRS